MHCLICDADGATWRDGMPMTRLCFCDSCLRDVVFEYNEAKCLDRGADDVVTCLRAVANVREEWRLAAKESK
jgi:hypothetical protein